MRWEINLAQQALVDGFGYEIRPASEEELLRELTEIDTAARGRGEPVMAMPTPRRCAAESRDRPRRGLFRLGL